MTMQVDNPHSRTPSFGSYTETLRTIASLYDIAEALVYEVAYEREMRYRRGYLGGVSAAYWLAAAARLPEPWNHLARAVATKRHKVHNGQQRP